MLKVLNFMFLVLKFLLLMICFVGTFYIMMNMYDRLGKNILDAIPTFIPFFFLLVLFTINVFFSHKSVTENLFYNITCCLCFSVIGFAIYRALFDKNMVIISKLGYNINFNYFSDVIAIMKAMLYLLVVSNILLIISGMKTKQPISRKVS